MNYAMPLIFRIMELVPTMQLAETLAMVCEVEVWIASCVMIILHHVFQNLFLNNLAVFYATTGRAQATMHMNHVYFLRILLWRLALLTSALVMLLRTRVIVLGRSEYPAGLRSSPGDSNIVDLKTNL